MSNLMEHIERTLRPRQIPVHLTEMLRRDQVHYFKGDDPAVFMHPLMWVQITAKTHEERWAGILAHIQEKIDEQALDAEMDVIAATTPERWKASLTARAIMRDLEEA